MKAAGVAVQVVLSIGCGLGAYKLQQAGRDTEDFLLFTLTAVAGTLYISGLSSALAYLTRERQTATVAARSSVVSSGGTSPFDYYGGPLRSSRGNPSGPALVAFVVGIATVALPLTAQQAVIHQWFPTESQDTLPQIISVVCYAFIVLGPIFGAFVTFGALTVSVSEFTEHPVVSGCLKTLAFIVAVALSTVTYYLIVQK